MDDACNACKQPQGFHDRSVIPGTESRCHASGVSCKPARAAPCGEHCLFFSTQVKVAAVHARVGELERQKAALQAELLPLLERHEALASSLALPQLQVRQLSPHYGPRGAVQACVPQGMT